MSTRNDPAMDRSIEQFLILCLRGRWDADALERVQAQTKRGDVDWDRLAGVALDAGLAPLLYPIVRERQLVPGPVEESLSYAYYYCAARNAVVLERLKGILAALGKENIPVLLLKGAALVERVYHNAAVRPMGDIDLLVPRRSLAQAMRTLAASCRVPERVGTYLGANIALAKPSAPDHHGHGRMAFDLNSYLVESPYVSHLRFVDWLWETASPGEITGAAVWELSPEALVLHLVAHLLMDQMGKRLLWLHDVAEVLTLYREQLNWSALLEHARHFDLVLPLRNVLARLEQDWHIVIPEAYKQSLQALGASATELRFYAWFAARYQPEPMLFAPDRQGNHGARARGYVWDNLMPPPAYMSERYQIGHPLLLPLAYPYRWYRGMRSALVDSLPRRLRRTSVVENGSLALP